MDRLCDACDTVTPELNLTVTDMDGNVLDSARVCAKCACNPLEELGLSGYAMSRSSEREPKTTTCAGCGYDYPDGDMIPLTDGGELCPKCAAKERRES